MLYNSNMINLTIGKIIRELRKEKKLTQKALAMKLQKSQRLISYWETDRQKPQIEELKMLADFFDVSFSKLINFCFYKNKN